MPARSKDKKHISETTLTLERRILLHLLNLYGRRDDYEVPMEMSQEGMGRTYGVRQSSISRVINKMLKEGLVEERAAYVTRSKQRRKVYCLTHKGYSFALEGRKALEVMLVTLIIDNEPMDVELREVNDHLTSSMDMMEIIRNLGPRGELDVSTIIRTVPRKEKEPVFFGDPIPKGRTFVGRLKELRNLERWLNSKTVKVVCIHGVVGIGKTALVERYLEGLEGRDVFYFRSREWSTLSSLLGALGTFLSRTGRRGLASRLRKEGPVDLKDLMAVLEAEARDLDAILVFDDFHTVGQNVMPFFTELIEVLPRTRAHAVMLTRYTLPFYDRRHVVVKGVVKELSLEGLSKKDCVTILKDKDLDRATMAHVYDVTGGHPLALELIGILGNLKEVDKFVFEEIYSTLTAKEKSVLQMTSIMRYPATMEVLLTVGTTDIMDELVRKALIREVGNGYEIQDLLREFFHTRTTPKVKRDLHAIAAEHYRDQVGPKAVIETAHHIFRSGKRNEAIDLLVSKADQLVQEGLVDEMIAVIDGFGPDIPKERYRDAYQLREKAANVWGTWDNYLEYIFECLLFERHLGTRLKTLSRELRTSFLGRSAEDTEDSLADLERALQVLKKIGDVHGIGHTLYSMAWIRWVRGEFGKARREARKVLEMEVEDELRARTVMMLSGIEVEAGQTSGSVSWSLKARRLYRKIGMPEGDVQARVFETGAQSLSKVGGKDGKRLAAKLRRQVSAAIDLARVHHLPRPRAYAELRMCQCLLLSGEAQEAERSAKEAIGSFTLLNDGMGASFARLTAAMAILSREGNITEAIELLKTSVEELGKLCLDRLTGIVHLLLEKVYSSTGDTFGAESSRKDAKSLGVVPRKR